MIKKLQEALRNDEELFDCYKDNIAVDFQDAVRTFRDKRNKHYLSHRDIHEISNNAAENFLKRLSYDNSVSDGDYKQYLYDEK